ncbi:MAG: PAS domain S-box protein [Nitrospirae bacterium]|nr:PAS domain S-box protein [Nitrospirota bacterium]
MSRAGLFLPSGYRSLSVLIGSMVAGTLLIGGIALSVIERQLLETNGQTLALAAGEVADKLDRIMFERRGDAQMMARAFTGRCRDQAYISAYLHWMSQAYPLYESLSMVDVQGRVLASTSQGFVGQDVSQSPWFSPLRDGRVMGVQQWESTGQGAQEAGVSFAAAITDDQGRFCGVVLSRVGLEVLGEVVTRKWQASNSQMMPFSFLEYQFVTSEGLAFLDSLHREGMEPANLKVLAVPSFLRAEREDVGFLEELHPRRQVWVLTGFARTQDYRDSANAEWMVLLRADRAALLAPIRTRVAIVGLLGLLGLVPLVLGLLWLLRRLQHVGQGAKLAEQALSESEHRFQILFGQTSVGVAEIDTVTGRFIRVNRKYGEILGYSTEEMCSLDFMTITYPDDLTMDLAQLEQLRRGELSDFSMEKRLVRKDGSIVWVELTVSPLWLDGEAPTRHMAVVKEITERKRTEETLRESEVRSRSIIETAFDAVVATNKDGCIIGWNPQAEALFGYSAHEAIGRGLSETIIPVQFRQAHAAGIARVFQAGGDHGLKRRREFSALHRDGHEFPVELAIALFHVSGQPVLSAFIRDITQRKQAEEVLIASEAKFRSIISAAPVPMALSDDAQRITFLNPAFVQTFGYGLEEIPTLAQWWPLAYPDPAYRQWVADTWLTELARMKRTGTPFSPMEVTVRCKDGESRAVLASAAPLGHVFEDTYLVALIDVTQQKQDEKALSDSTARLNGIIESAMDAIITVDEQQRIVVFNGMAEKIFGWSAKQMMGQPLDILLPQRSRSGHAGLVRTFVESGFTARAMGALGQVTGLRASGEEFPVEASISKTMVAGQVYCSVILRDITERQRGEASLFAHARQQEAVAKLGLYALLVEEATLVLHEATRLMKEALGADYSKVLELLPGGEMFLLRAGTGWPEGLVGHAQVSAGLDSQAGYTLASSEPVVVQDLRCETRFSGPPLLHQQGITSGMSVVIYCNGRPWGVLGTHSRVPNLFSHEDTHFLQAFANVLGATLERQMAEQALAQSERLLREALEERERMAMNLHDGVIQSLFAMGLTLRESQALIGEDEAAAKAQLSTGLGVLNGVIRELRESIIGGALSARGQQSFKETLTDLVANMRGPRGFLFQVALAPSALACLTEEMEEQCFFIVREAVSNAQRHSRAATGRVTLTLRDGGMRLMIEDDGRGFDPRQVSGQGLGLSNIAVRVEKIGGRYEVQSGVGQGVRIIVDLPCGEATCQE